MFAGHVLGVRLGVRLGVYSAPAAVKPKGRVSWLWWITSPRTGQATVAGKHLKTLRSPRQRITNKNIEHRESTIMKTKSNLLNSVQYKQLNWMKTALIALLLAVAVGATGCAPPHH